MPDYQICVDKVHGTLVAIEGKGVLLIGNSGVGKSDLALRLIERGRAVLVADDVVCLTKVGDQLIGQADDKIAGLLEVRGLGIIPYAYRQNAAVNLVIELKNTAEDVERFPQIAQENILGVEIPKIDLYAKECSAVEKVCLGLRLYGG